MNNFTSRLKGTLFLFLLLFFSAQLLAQCPNLVWSDDFTGTSLDLNKWSYQIGDGCAEGICGWGNNELQYYQQSNITLSNGQLHITAKRERVQSKSYTSGRIRTLNKGDWTYGRFESRIKVPAGKGLWPAFWMLPTDEVYGVWPKSGEIDIMEYVSAQSDHILGTIHYGDPYPNNRNQGGNFYLNSGAFSDDWHDFAVEWEADTIRWFVDGILFLTKTTQDISPYQWPFDQRFHFLLNVAVGGNLGGTVDNTIFPATMDVEFVKVYDGFKPYITGKRIALYQETGVTYKVGNISNGTSVTWTVPAGATIVSGQGTSQVTINFGSASGNVVASFSTGCGSQQLTIPVLVEAQYVKDFSFENFDQPATATFGTYTGTLSEVSNPSASGVNTSALVGKYVRNSAEQYDILTYNVSNITDGSQYSNKNKKFYIDLYTSAPVGTEVILQLETSTATSTNYPTGRHSRYTVKTTAQNQWQRIPFTLLDKPDASASSTGIVRAILLFASNTLTGDTYYYDNFDSYNTVGAATGTSMSVSSIITGTAASGGGSKFGTATVTVLDNLGNPVSNATVTGTFSGSFSETKSGVTGANGTVTITTTAKLKGTLVVNFCVTNVTHSTLAYNASGNTITCTGAGGRLASANEVAIAETLPVSVYPVPFTENFNVKIRLQEESLVEVVLIDMNGKDVGSFPAARLSEGEHSIPFDHVRQPGLYLVRTIINGRQYLIKQIKQH